MDRMKQNPTPRPHPARAMRFTVERRVLVWMLEAVARRAPRRGRPEKMVRLSACGPCVYVEANGKATATEALVFAEGACLLVHKTILHLLRGYARRVSRLSRLSQGITQGITKAEGFSEFVPTG